MSQDRPPQQRRPRLTAKRTAVIAGIVVVVFAAGALGLVVFGHRSGPTTAAPATTAVPTTAAATTTVAAPATTTASTTTAPTTIPKTIPPTTPATTAAPSTSTTSTTLPPAASGPTFAQLVATIQGSLRAGKLAGAGAVPDASLSCPHPVEVAAGNAFACRVASKAVGNAVLVVELTSATGDYTPFIGDEIGCSSLTQAGQAALRSIGTTCTAAP
jgi:hypothetical protein